MASCIEQLPSYMPFDPDREGSVALIDKINKRVSSADKFFSLEFFPPRTANGTCNLLQKCDRLSQGSPLFCDVTCNLSRKDVTLEKENNYLTLASTTQELLGMDSMLQLNCTDLTEEDALDILIKAKSLGLKNVLAIRQGTSTCHDFCSFRCTAEVVRFIRDNFGNFFTICIAGYPDAIDRKVSHEESLNHLKEQVEAGADFIITQMVFEAEKVLEFMDACQKIGIKVPIIPGIFPIQSYGSMRQLAKFSMIQIPQRIMNIINPIKDNDETVLKYGVYLTVELCKVLLQSSLVHGLHFFTLNREVATKQILKSIGLWREEKIQTRALPWQQADDEERRIFEDVRPIFWSNRPYSYMYRTSGWEEFPNGRWGDSTSASFGEFKEYNLFFQKNRDRLNELKKMWGESLSSKEDVHDVFVALLTKKPNKYGVKVTTIPWTEDDLAPETSVITEQLIALNRNGILTINSQPNVNCVISTDKMFGWGSPGGYVFQKAYLEFFASREDAMNLLKVLPEYPFVNYHIVNKSGHADFTNADISSIAVTWGVFSGKPIIQPTVVDPVAFQSWKDEAFDLWIQQWGKLYPEQSKSRQIIEEFYNEYYLVNLVDNDYVSGNSLFNIINKAVSMRGRCHCPKDDQNCAPHQESNVSTKEADNIELKVDFNYKEVFR